MTRLRSLAVALLAVPSVAMAQASAPASEQRRSAEANEPTGIGAATARDAEASRRALDGWWREAGKTRDQRLAWFRQARFGVFVHWGPYSVLGGQWRGQPNPGYSEHIMRVARIPRQTYRDEVAAKFHPDAYDARTWVKAMKAAGAGYVILTAKHHDGFALWPSKASDYNIAQVSGFKRDPLAELVAAARAEGLKVGFYYSHAFDWEDPDAPGNDWDYDNPGGDRKLHGGIDWWNAYPQFLTNTDRYIDRKVIPQLNELITHYHPDILWFDTPGKLPFFQQARIVEAVRKADPNVVINGRAARSADLNLGDYLDTADRPAELRPTAGDWEAIPTTNESYGFNALDHSHKSVAHFVQLIAKATAKGGNILLNVGPRGDGTLDAPDAAILAGVGQWMGVNGESIKGASRTPLDRQAWGDTTVKGDRLYLHVFDWPRSGSLRLGGLTSPPKRAYLLATKAPVAIKPVGSGDYDVALPANAPDAADSVIVVETDGPVRGETGRLIETRWGTNQLLAFDATALGSGFSYGDGKTARFYVDGLEKTGNRLVWPVRATAPAPVRVRVRYSTPGETSARVLLRYGDATLAAQLTPTHGDRDLQEVELGVLDLKSGALQDLTLSLEADHPVHIFSLDLRP
ncbi:MAG: alpha-L-fucosidase [Caulobacter sp.]|nr:alpha-L-fucosidase [Caulobacter sp.]